MCSITCKVCVIICATWGIGWIFWFCLLNICQNLHPGASNIGQDLQGRKCGSIYITLYYTGHNVCPPISTPLDINFLSNALWSEGGILAYILSLLKELIIIYYQHLLKNDGNFTISVQYATFYWIVQIIFKISGVQPTPFWNLGVGPLVYCLIFTCLIKLCQLKSILSQSYCIMDTLSCQN